jgi:NIPSNAP
LGGYRNGATPYSPLKIYEQRKEQTMFFELREYRIKGGHRERWVKLMEEKIIPFQMSKGMVAVGSFVATDEPDLYVWIRRFESEEERDRLYKEVYESDYWKDVIKPESNEMLDRERMKVTRLEATPKSVIR